MRKSYRVERMTYGGNYERTIVFSNKKQAKSFAYRWILNQKNIIRYRNGGEREYGQLSAVVYGGDDYADGVTNEFWVAGYN